MSSSKQDSESDGLGVHSLYDMTEALPESSSTCLLALKNYPISQLEDHCQNAAAVKEEFGDGESFDDVEQSFIARFPTAKNSFDCYRNKNRAPPSEPSDDEDLPLVDSDSSDDDIPAAPLQPLKSDLEDQSLIQWVRVPADLRDPVLRPSIFALLRAVVQFAKDETGDSILGLHTYDQKTESIGIVQKQYEKSPLTDEDLMGGIQNIVADFSHAPASTGLLMQTKPSILNPPRLVFQTTPFSESIFKSHQVGSNFNSLNSAFSAGCSKEFPPPAKTAVVPKVSPIREETKKTLMETTMWEDSDGSGSEPERSASDDEEGEDPPQDWYTFTTPIIGSTKMSNKKFPGRVVWPMLKAEMSAPMIFRSILEDLGQREALEGVLDIKQTFIA